MHVGHRILFWPILLSLGAVTAASGRNKAAFIDEILRESLRAHRVQACDGERITLNCPRNTQILVQTGFYGRVVPESQLCPPADGVSTSNRYYSTCDVIQAHTRISEVCDKRRKCTVVVDSHTFDDDPCPATSKYLQMSYACLPVSFDDETFCSSDEMKLECREGRRLAVYSATMKTTPRCSPNNRTLHDCSWDVLPTVLAACHAKTACTLSSQQLASRCRDSHLHIVYMCVNEEIFSEEAIKGELPSLEKYIKESERKKKEEEKIPEDEWQKIEEQPAVAPAKMEPNDVMNNDASYVTHDEYRMVEDPKTAAEVVDANVVGIGHDIVQVVTFIRENKEKALTCAVLSLSLAAIIVLSSCIISRLCKKGKKTNPRHSLETSRLVNSHYGVTTPSTTHQLCDIDDECFMRYSVGGNKTTYSPYDF